ncbi:MAG TPA: hypothetical protein VHW02_12005 [Rhizomicrobium sp.]|jgi:hypothetical protein|nr:hypothetical protein [Rhizomicrobium sp.]
MAATLCAGIFLGQAWAAQGRMTAALTFLGQAHNQLQAANANKGGHRVTALHYIDLATAQVRAGIAAGEQ